MNQRLFFGGLVSFLVKTPADCCAGAANDARHDEKRFGALGLQGEGEGWVLCFQTLAASVYTSLNIAQSPDIWCKNVQELSVGVSKFYD